MERSELDTEKILKAVDIAQDRFKIVTDLGVKGILFHLGISAFSLTFGFQHVGPWTRVLLGANVLVTALALCATVAIAQDADRVRNRIIRWHRDLGLEIDAGEMRGLITTAWFYAIVCAIMVTFWIWLISSLWTPSG